MPFALDYSAGRPTAAQVKAAGFVGVVRYIGFPANRKCITSAEYADMVTAGVGVSLVYEQTAGDALNGRPAGRAAAQLALAHARTIGYPVDQRPIYYACDTDVVTEAQFLAVLDYLRGAGDVHGGPARVGVYGEFDVVERAATAGVAAWYWQTMAWSRGQTNPRAHLLQILGQVTVGGIACDRNTIRAADWGQTGATAPPEPPPREDPDMIVLAGTSGLAYLAGPPPVGVRGLSAAQRDAFIAAGVPVGPKALTEAQINDLRAGLGGDPALDALAKTLAAVAVAVAGQANDEARILSAAAADTAEVLAAVRAVIVSPGTDHTDPDAFVTALADTLARGKKPV